MEVEERSWDSLLVEHQPCEKTANCLIIWYINLEMEELI